MRNAPGSPTCTVHVEVMCTRGIDADGTRDPRTFENRVYAYAITRRTVIELGVQIAVRAIHADELRVADELFATSTAGELMPITRLDRNPV